MASLSKFFSALTAAKIMKYYSRSRLRNEDEKMKKKIIFFLLTASNLPTLYRLTTKIIDNRQA